MANPTGSLYTTFFIPVGGTPSRAVIREYSVSGPEGYNGRTSFIHENVVFLTPILNLKALRNRWNGASRVNDPTPEAESEITAVVVPDFHNSDAMQNQEPTTLSQEQPTSQQMFHERALIIMQHRWEQVNLLFHTKRSPFPQEFSALNIHDARVRQDLLRVLGNDLYEIFSCKANIYLTAADGSASAIHNQVTMFLPVFWSSVSTSLPNRLTWDDILAIEVASLVRGTPYTQFVLTPSGKLLRFFDPSVAYFYFCRWTRTSLFPPELTLRNMPIPPERPPNFFDLHLGWNPVTGEHDLFPTDSEMSALFYEILKYLSDTSFYLLLSLNLGYYCQMWNTTPPQCFGNDDGVDTPNDQPSF
ncbi:hypothetical protein JR316_0004307 [Psilocybe cubensis]|uniref:Uncharacterized protein n=2 Tax=Psilocybe cubensis TaxID=181762 RepID=A0A8H8CKJ2_PSICU|nr:hypothetical protein JR316_0004307 [Psilocybe cubensis]KAH9482212.1 hypothetical protein JR316_0004307 [Psilocybe cubensis]